jgi:hypothetical protein
MTFYISQPNGTDSTDTYIASNAATTNFNTSLQLLVGEADDAIQIGRALLKFDLSQLSSKATILSATLRLYMTAEKSSNARTLRVYRSKRAWTAGGATWNKYDGSSDWQTAGGFGANDCEQTDIGTLSLSATETAGYKDIPLTVAAIQTMITGGAWTNNGFLLMMDTESADQYIFDSSSAVGDTKWPKLTIEHDLPGEDVPPGNPTTVYYTNQAKLEADNLSELTGSSPVDATVATLAAAKYAGNYGLAINMTDTTARYVYWTVGNVTRCVTEFMFDPNSATIPNFIPICEVLNASGDGMFRINVMKSTGQSTYTVAVSTHQYTRQQSYTMGSENNVWSLAKWFANMTDAYHKIRINCNLFKLTDPSFEPMYGGECHLFIDDIFVGSITRTAGPSVGLISKTRQADGAITTVRYGVTQTAPASIAVKLYFDNLYESDTYSDLSIPQRLVTRSDKILFRASAEGNDNWLEPNIIELIKGTTGTIKVEFNTGTVTAATVAAYRSRRLASIFATNTCTVNENIVTTPTFSGMVGNNSYTIEISAVIDGRTVVRRLVIRCIGNGDATQGTFVEPKTIYRIAGASETLEVVFENAEEISSPSVKAYRGRRDLTATVFPSGSSVAAGNAMITPVMTGLVGGQKYVLEFTATIDGYTTVRKALLRTHAHGMTL